MGGMITGKAFYGPHRPERGQTRRAFTLVELLVVIAIIGTLVGMLLPAVQSAREAARVSQCGNNLKQYALGMQNYHDAQGVLPLGTSYWQCINVSWLPVLWPYIELNDLASRFKYNQTFGGWPNVGSASQRLPLSLPISLYYCPSDRPNAVQVDAWNTVISRSNYATNGTALVRSGVTHRGPFVTYFNGAKSDCAGSGWVVFEPRGYKGKEATRFKTGGCGTSKPVMEGTVTLDGVPIEKGVIVLTPPDGKGQTAGCGITAGSYRMQASPGMKQVSIIAERKDGKMPDPMSPGSGAVIDRYVNYVPERYNTKSELTVTIKPGLNKHDFALEGGAVNTGKE
jgi:prepilin-type N-terminal cleavage/methylation domain-containing protein